MLIDRRVNRRKFDEEVKRIIDHRDQLTRWSCSVRAIDYPHIDIDFALRHHLQLLGVILQPAVARQLVEQVRRQNAVIRSGGFGVRFALDDYDQLPPAVTFCDRMTRQPLLWGQMMAGAFIPNPAANGAMVNVIVDDKLFVRRPFLCIRGTREYHQHPQHTGDYWQLYRGSIGIFTLIQRISEACVDHSRPVLMAAGAGALQLCWLAA